MNQLLGKRVKTFYIERNHLEKCVAVRVQVGNKVHHKCYAGNQ